jgi:hypothetical protein
LTASQEEWRRRPRLSGALLARGVLLGRRLSPSCSRKRFYGAAANVRRSIRQKASAPPRRLSLSFFSGSEYRLHFARQFRAKSNQVLSAAAPVSFILCHSSPHACIRGRDAGGRFRGCRGRSGFGLGASIGAAGIAGAEGKSIVGRSPAERAGRAGGSGAVKDWFDFSAASCANVGRRMI